MESVMKAVLITCLGLMASLLTSGVAAQTRYAVSADQQEVTDARTGLIWRRCAEGMTASGSTCSGGASTFSHEAALQHAATQASSSGLAWRLPNVKELASIADRSRVSPAIDNAAFPGAPSTPFWSSTPNVGNPFASMGVNFRDGVVDNYTRSGSYQVRLVRAGQ